MALVINFYGGPGTGKSTTATALFSLLKSNDINAEYVSEYAKQWAWEERKPISYDQFYFFGKQSRREYSLFNNVDVIITDSPVSLCSYYAAMFGKGNQPQVFNDMIKCYYAMTKEDGHTYVHIWLNRKKKYNPKGRFQNEEEAKKIDKKMLSLLPKALNLKFVKFDADKTASKNIFKYLKDKKLI